MKFHPSALAAVIIPLLATAAVKAECPNLYPELESQGQSAVERFNAAGESGRCAAARELVRIEQRLSRFVEDYQVRCVIDPEVIEVQLRRFRKAKEQQDRFCHH